MKNKIIVIKIGSSVYVTNRRKVDEFRVFKLTENITLLRQNGWKVILVVSGAVALGMRAFDDSIEDDVQKRCAAGVGQVVVLSEFYKRLCNKNIHCAQVLLTKYQLENKKYRHQLQTTLQLYLDHNILPILNENDVVDLYAFGGNDELSFTVAKLTNAQKLLILSSFTSHFGFGGDTSKTHVVEKAKKEGISATIADGKKPWIHLIQN